MRFMVIVKATKSSEAGTLSSKELLAEMGKYKRRTDQSRPARRRRTAAKLEGGAGQVRGRQTDGDRWAIRRGKGAGCRLLAEVRLVPRGYRAWERMSETERNALMDECFTHDDVLRTKVSSSMGRRVTAFATPPRCDGRMARCPSRRAVCREGPRKACNPSHDLVRFKEDALDQPHHKRSACVVPAHGRRHEVGEAGATGRPLRARSTAPCAHSLAACARGIAKRPGRYRRNSHIGL